MKLFNRSHFAVRHAASKDATRFNLCGVHFRKDGSVEATDGHIAAQVTSDTPSVEEFPHVGITQTDESLKPFILPLEAANEVAKSIPRRQAMPVLEHAVLNVAGANSGDHVQFVTTDLQTKKPLESCKVDGEYPNIDNAMPTMKGKPAFILDALLVERACKIAREFRGGNAKQSPVMLQFYPGKTDLNALGIRVEDSDAGELKVVIMPIRK